MNKEAVKQKLVYLLLIFIIGAFVGWLYEVIFYYFTENNLANRGILYGPWLPIYGVGAILISYLKPLKKHPILIFLLIMLVTGILEYVIGIIDIKVFNVKLWDYSNLPFNIQGVVCLRSVITFAIGGIALIYLIEPILEKILKKVNKNKLYIASIIFIIIFIIDIILSNLYRTPITYWKNKKNIIKLTYKISEG